MEDADFESPEAVPISAAPLIAAPAVASAASAEDISVIESMGFTKLQAVKALSATNNDIARAADWIFSHMVCFRYHPPRISVPPPKDFGTTHGLCNHLPCEVVSPPMWM